MAGTDFTWYGAGWFTFYVIIKGGVVVTYNNNYFFYTIDLPGFSWQSFELGKR